MNRLLFTPGPWAAAARQGVSWDLVVYKPGTSLEICQMFHDFTRGNQIGEANAKLVAASPEMYEALIRAERKLTAYVGVCGGDKELTQTVLPLCRAVLSRLGEAASR
jgi:hypothetical protein